MATSSKNKRKSSVQEKRRHILKAAIRVFSEKGFHRCRISDIASEAEVAYGLVYHYFKNKEEILNSIFDENWGLLTKVIDTVQEQSESLEEQLLAIVSIMLDAYRLVPDIIQVIVMEIARSSKLLKEPRIDSFEKAFNRLAEVFATHQKTGEVPADMDPKLLAYSFFGMIELILTGFLLGTLKPEEGDKYEQLKPTLVKTFLNGILGSKTA
jgi:TetR/AcrR family fatty acid metabolism transcriptional regulator